MLWKSCCCFSRVVQDQVTNGYSKNNARRILFWRERERERELVALLLHKNKTSSGPGALAKKVK
jgi:hypothetical protein